MFLLHYLIPFVVFYFVRKKMILYGLLLGNLADIDHIYYRIIGKVPWFSSACQNFGANCSIDFYPLHSLTFLLIFLGLSSLIFVKNKKIKFVGWIFLGAFLNLILDYVHLIIGLGI